MFDVAIIGAGVVGGMIARKLSAYDLSICILEKENDVAMGATKANSAIVHAGFDAKEGTLKAKLNVKGAEMMKQVTEELGVKYINNGSLVVGLDDTDRRSLEELYKRGVKNGVKGLKLLERDEVKALEPNISDEVNCALYAPSGAIVCPYELAVAAVGNAMDNGAELFRNFEVVSIVKNDGVFTVSSNNNEIRARFVVNAAGVYSDKIAALNGDDSFNVHPRRGEYVLLDKECGKIVSNTIFRTPNKMGKGILISPTVDGNLILGPTAFDIDDKEDKSIAPDFFSNIYNEAKKSVKNIAPGKTITSFCGLRSVGSTGDFIINAKNGFVNTAGIESPGLSSAPAIAEYVCELLNKEGLALSEKVNYNPVRKPTHAFRDASIEEKNAMIKKNAAYGRVICRCETVTEGEILDALRTNPKAVDLDGIKRRTRAQMGRCQGGFCSTYIIDLIARELNIPYESVTKFGGGSVINYGKTKGGASND